MGQKVNPLGIRLGITRDWVSKWYAGKKQFADADPHRLPGARVPAARSSPRPRSAASTSSARPRKVNITIQTARPGIVIGKKGEDIEKLRAETAKLLGMPVGDVRLNVAEIRKPELDSQLVAEGIAQQIEKRVMFRRAMKRAVMSTMRSGALGMKVRLSGRLNGSEIARTEMGARRPRAAAHLPRRHRLRHGRSPHHLWRDRRQGLDLQGRSVRQGAGSRRRGRRGRSAAVTPVAPPSPPSCRRRSEGFD